MHYSLSTFKSPSVSTISKKKKNNQLKQTLPVSTVPSSTETKTLPLQVSYSIQNEYLFYDVGNGWGLRATSEIVTQTSYVDVHRLKKLNCKYFLRQNVPKPRSKNHYCSVCRQNYGDYLEVKVAAFSIFRVQCTRKRSNLQNSTSTFLNSPKNLIKQKLRKSPGFIIKIALYYQQHYSNR